MVQLTTNSSKNYNTNFFGEFKGFETRCCSRNLEQ